jgi:hypothetical protein
VAGPGIRALFVIAVAGIMAICIGVVPATAQQVEPAPAIPHADKPPVNWFRSGISANSTFTLSLPASSRFRDFSIDRPAELSSFWAKPSQSGSAGTIAKMEAAFHCNDTPFIDQVRLPLASLWGGRVKLIGMESDVTTANFVLGLPGAGILQNFSMTGSGHLATHIPPSDQLVGMHLTFYLRGGEVGAQDNSGLRGAQYLVRASRDFIQTFVTR